MCLMSGYNGWILCESILFSLLSFLHSKPYAKRTTLELILMDKLSGGVIIYTCLFKVSKNVPRMKANKENESVCHLWMDLTRVKGHF